MTLKIVEPIQIHSNIFELPPDALPLLDGLSFHVLRNGQKLHASQVTKLSPTSFALNFEPNENRDVIEVLYDDISASLTINCGGITNNILPIKGKIIDAMSINGQVQQEVSVQGYIPFLSQIDGRIANAVTIQASAIPEDEIFGVVNTC